MIAQHQVAEFHQFPSKSNGIVPRPGWEGRRAVLDCFAVCESFFLRTALVFFLLMVSPFSVIVQEGWFRIVSLITPGLRCSSFCGIN